ncbi:hypothetical protein ACVD2R_11260 [Escherichia coli]
MHFWKMKVVFLFIHILAVVMISVMTVHLCSMAVEKMPEEYDIPVGCSPGCAVAGIQWPDLLAVHSLYEN